MAKDTYYFSHDYNARNDEKILELRAKFGPAGYGIFWMLVESMAENTNASINIKLIAGLSVSYGVGIAKLTEIIKFCTLIGLLKSDGDFIYSKRLKEHQKFRTERSETGKVGAEKKWKTVREKKAQFQKMVEFFDNTCVRCEGASGLANVERDHIIPSYKGGIDDITNWQPLCAKCNSSKGPEETDHRIKYAEKHGLAIPNEWLSHSVANAKERKEKEKKVFIAPTALDVQIYFKEKGYSPESANKAFFYYSEADWKDSRGNQVKNWKQKMQANWFKDEYKISSQSRGVVI